MGLVSPRLLLLPLVLVLAAGVGLAQRGDRDDGSAPLAVVPASAIRGVTLSTVTYNREWAGDETAASIAELKELGAGWVAFHPYAQIRRDGSVTWRSIDADDPPTWLRRPIDEAHRLGLKVMVKPHLAYWGSPWAWRGEIELKRGEELDRFFQSYGAWIEQVALATSDADLFVVATELDRLAHHEQRWREVIARVRAVHDAPLTWAANHDRYAALPFWDALDHIGVQAYFPLLDEGRTGDLDERGVPTRAALDAGWTRVAAELRTFSERTGRPVLLTELGYNRSSRAPYEPWAYEQGGDHAEEVQVRCLEAGLAAVEAEPAIVGAFLWKWFPGERQRGDFLMSRPAPRAAIERAWR